MRRFLCTVSRVVRNVQLLSNSAGDFNSWSPGVVLYYSIPRYGSSPSSSHLRSVSLTIGCTMRSANPFDWGYSGELVICSTPYDSVNWWNSRQLFCGPLSVRRWERIPCSAKMLFIWFMIARELVPVSFLMIGTCYNGQIVQYRYWWPLYSNKSELSLSHGLLLR